MDTNTCDAMATCMNTMGSYECMCNMGYDGDGFVCTGITLLLITVTLYILHN